MKRRGWKYDRGHAHPLWICIICATLIFIVNNISAKELPTSETKDIITKFKNVGNQHHRKALVVKVNRTKPQEVKYNDREYVYLTDSEANDINKDEYYYYYEDVFYDDVGEDLYELEASKNNKTKEKQVKLKESFNKVETENLKVTINVDNGDTIRKERDSHLSTHILPHTHLTADPFQHSFEPPEVYSTGWVVIPQRPPHPGNYVHVSTTPAPPALHVKHHNIHHHDPHQHQDVDLRGLVPVTTIGTITTTHSALPTPTQHLPFLNFPKYHKHKTQYEPKNVYVKDQSYVTVTRRPILQQVKSVKEITASTTVTVHPPHQNTIKDSRQKRPKVSLGRDHKVLDDVYHFQPHHTIIPTAAVPPRNNYLPPPTQPTPSYHYIATTSAPVAQPEYPSYYRPPPHSSHHIHYNPHVRYPQTTTTTASNPNDKRPQRDYFPAPRIIGLLQDEGATTLLDLIEKANLTDVLNNRDATFTLFAPTNEAFAKLDPNLVATLTEDDGGDFDLLRSVLLYHVVPRKIYTRNFNDDTTLETALVIDSDEDKDVKDEEGSGDDTAGEEEASQENRELRVTKNEENKVVTINGVHVDIKNSDQSASNGVVHFVKEVIYPIPTGTIFETLARDNRFSILVDLLEAAELAAALNTSSADALTIFAPTDDAFLKLPRSGLEEIVEDKQQVTDLLFNHVTMGTKLSPDLTFTTLNSLTPRKNIDIQVRRGQVYVGSGKLIDGDIITTNGAIQVIDTVLL
jgi:uncharacterized surface protein with fasciclin (FAS1) repeats